MAVAHVAGSDSVLFTLIGAVVCFVMRLVGLRYGIDAPSPSDRFGGERAAKRCR